MDRNSSTITSKPSASKREFSSPVDAPTCLPCSAQAGKKDDNAHIEQKNWTHVGKIFGYLRYDSSEALSAINDLAKGACLVLCSDGTMTKKLLRISLGLSTLLLFGSQAGFAQTNEELKALGKEIESLKQGQSAIQKDLEEIKTLLRGRVATPPPEPQNVVLSVKDDPFKGKKDVS